MHRAAAATGSAILLGVALWPGPQGLVSCVAFLPLLWALREAGAARAFALGWWFGTVLWLVGAFWLAGSTLRFVSAPAPVAFLIFLLVCAGHGLGYGLGLSACALAAGRLRAARGWSADASLAAAFPAAWVCIEGFWPKLFPGTLAETLLVHPPAAQLAALGGAAACAWLVALVNSGLFLASRAPAGRTRRLALAGALAALAGNELFGLARARAVTAATGSAGRALSVAVLQGAIPSTERFRPEAFARNLAVYRGLAEEAVARGAELVVWPQGSYERELRFSEGGPGLGRPEVDGVPLAGFLERDLPRGAWQLVGSLAKRFRRRGGKRVFRRHRVSVLADPAGRYGGAAAKRKPTPLAEFIPFGRLMPRLYRLAPGMERIWSGPQEPLDAGGARLGVFVCYDAVHPEPARRLTRAGAELLVNPSSDAWWNGERVEPAQHLRLAQLRALENGRWLVRATVSGISAVIDPAGRIAAAAPMGARAALLKRVPLLRGAAPSRVLGPALYGAAAVALAGLCLLRPPRAAAA